MKRKLSIILGVIIVLYICAANTFSTSKIAFSLPSAILGIVLIFAGFFWTKISLLIEKREALKVCFKIFKAAVTLLIILLLVIEGIIVSYPKHNTDESDYIMVLGAGLSNGYYPSLTLSYRLNAAYEVYEDLNGAKKIVVSGGQGGDEKISEAEAMKSYLMDKGVSENMIVVEDKSATTSENFKFSKEVIEKDAGKSIEDVKVKVVTTDFHAFRSRIIAKKCGYGDVNNFSSDTVWYLIPVNYFRESFAVVKSTIFD